MSIPASIATRLSVLADDMEALGVDLDYFGGFNPEWQRKSAEMLGAATVARQWAAAITEEAA